MDDDELVRLISARCPELGEIALDRIASALAGQTVTPLTGEQAERLIEAARRSSKRGSARRSPTPTAYREAADAAASFIDSADIGTMFGTEMDGPSSDLDDQAMEAETDALMRHAMPDAFAQMLRARAAQASIPAPPRAPQPTVTVALIDPEAMKQPEAR